MSLRLILPKDSVFTPSTLKRALNCIVKQERPSRALLAAIDMRRQQRDPKNSAE